MISEHQSQMLNPQKLVDLLDGQQKLLEAKDRRIKHLEFLLGQRTRETLKRYDQIKPRLDRMKGRVLQVFLEHPGEGLSYPDVNDLFKQKYRFESAHIPQRVRDLFAEGKVWKSPDDEGTMRYYLKLDEEDKP